MFDGFADERVPVAELAVRVRYAGSGPAVLLVHGHPRTGATWHRVAPLLVQSGFTVVCPDMRGYGRSEKAPLSPDHSQQSKRAVARDLVALMRRLDPVACYGGDPVLMGEEDHREYVDAITDPDTVRAMLEDYRAGLGVDREHEEADRRAGRQVRCPALFLWAARDDMEDLYGDPVEAWRPWAEDLRGQPIDSGHHIAEEQPEQLSVVLADFLAH